MHFNFPGGPQASAKLGEQIAKAVVFGGIAVRIYQWSLNRSLWQDEASLVANLLERDLSGLAEPLDNFQGAPYLFLAASELMTRLAGFDERVLRFLPLAASLTALWAFHLLARRLLGQALAVAATALIAFSYPHVYYAQEFKPYSLETLTTVALLWGLMCAGEAGDGRWRGLWCLGAVSIFASFTAPFVLAGVGVALVTAAVGAGEFRRRIGGLVWGGLGWVALFAVNYRIFLKVNMESEFMSIHWAFAKPGWFFTAEGGGEWANLLNVCFRYYHVPVWARVVFVFLGLVGVVHACRRRTPLMVAALVAVGCYLGAVQMGLAPFYGRLTLFLHPVAVLFVGWGCAALADWEPRMRPRLQCTFAVVLGATLFTSMRASVRPVVMQFQREGVNFLKEYHAAGEQVYVTGHARAAVEYYCRDDPGLLGECFMFSDARVWEASPDPKESPPRTRTDLDAVTRQMGERLRDDRFWLVVTHIDRHRTHFLELIEARLGYAADPGMRYERAGVGVYRLSRRSPADR